MLKVNLVNRYFLLGEVGYVYLKRAIERVLLRVAKHLAVNVKTETVGLYFPV